MPKNKDTRQAILESESEDSLLRKVIQLAELKGWKCYHVFEQKNYAKRTSSGFPDIVAVRDGRLLFIELKSEKGKLSKAQKEWNDKLGEVSLASCAVESVVCRPSDWDEIIKLLD